MVRLTSSERPGHIRYRKLHLGHEVRLLEIQPARRLDDPLVARLVTVPLRTVQADQQTIALSSLIGDPDVKEIIYIDGKPISLSAHRATALRQIRTVYFATEEQQRQNNSRSCSSSISSGSSSILSTTSPIFAKSKLLRRLLGLPQPKLQIWLDVLCVNQRSLDETSQLKETMRAVYEAAKVVLGWLGPQIPSTELGVRVLRAVDAGMPRFFGDPGDRAAHPAHYSPQHVWARQIEHLWQPGADGTPSFLLPHWIGCNDFMSRPYIQTQWILQEIAMATSPCLLIGDAMVPWTTILRVVQLVEEFRDYESEVFPAAYREALAQFPLGTLYEFLEAYAKRNQWRSSPAMVGGPTATASSTVICEDNKDDDDDQQQQQQRGGAIFPDTVSRHGVLSFSV